MQSRTPHETILPELLSHGETIMPEPEPEPEEDALGVTLLPTDVAPPPPPPAGTILDPFADSSETWQDQAPVAVDDSTQGDGVIEAAYRIEHSKDSLDRSRNTVLPKVDRTQGTPKLIVAGKNRFEVRGRLGEGGVGEVLLAVDHDIGRKVAIKKIRPDRQSQGAFLRFVQEIQTIGRLEHPNIIPIHDVGRDEHGEYYFVMKYVDGETLETIISRLRAGDPEYHKRYTFERRVQIFHQVLEAVAFAHSRAVIHRDIKPANIMVARYGEVLLLDWGIARADGVEIQSEGGDDGVSSGDRLTHTRAGALLGTPGYMAPEQARGESVDERADVYALSVLLHELLTLHHYLEDQETLDEVLDGVQNTPVPLAMMVKDAHQSPVPMDLSWFIRQGVYKDPSQRYQSVEEMIERLERRAEGDVPVECHITFTKKGLGAVMGLVDRHPMIASVAMMVLVLGVMGAFAGLFVAAVGAVGLALLV